jgi:tRNA pseudouridine38-40 synthase
MDDERTYRMELQYDGTGLHGWAKQEGRATVAGSLEQAFGVILGRVPSLRVAGRTDAGVHARHQVVSLRLPPGLDLSRLTRSLNALTPAGIAVTEIREAAPGFDARKDALSRTYRYFLQVDGVESPFCSRYCWRAPVAVRWELMRQAARVAEGCHDFTAFTPTETEHVFFHRRVLRCRWCRWGKQYLVLQIEAEAFLRHMVRTLVGTMVEVGAGCRGLEQFERLLQGAQRHEAGPTAPAHGLFLWAISYPQGL